MTARVDHEEWLRTHKGPYLRTEAYVWWCGDDHCDCTKATIEDVFRNLADSRFIIRVGVWEGSFFTDGEPGARQELQDKYDSMTEDERAKITWPDDIEGGRHSGAQVMAEQGTDLEYLVGRVRELATELEHGGRIQAMQSWPKGANGPIAVAAYEALVDNVESHIFMLRAACLRVDRLGGVADATD